MFWLIRFWFKWILRIKILLFAVGTGMAIAYGLQLREQYRTWGLVKADVDRPLSGDDLVDTPDLVETRRLDIDAPPSEVWPWLVQLGFGRGGWYGFQQMERPWSPAGGPAGSSADTILEEYQDLAEGDIVPMHRDGGFAARVVESETALVLYLDDSLLREQVQGLVAARMEEVEAAAEETDVASEATEAVDGISEAFGDMDLPPFAVSWAFVLEDAPGGRTHLVERIRFRLEGISDMQRRGTPLLSAGIFMQMRSQMLGIKQRVETLSQD